MLYLWILYTILALFIKAEVKSENVCPKYESSPPPCSTCAGRCGEVRDMEARGCSCDSQCQIYRDCCPDFEMECSNITAVKSNKTITFSCERIHRDSKESASFEFISTCGMSRCFQFQREVFSIIPVTDVDTNLHYLNFECAKCNKVKNVIPWQAKMSCEKTDFLYARSNISETITITEFKVLSKKFREGLCRVDISPPDSLPALRSCAEHFAVNDCRGKCTNTSLAEACSKGYLNYVKLGYTNYRNHFCAWCIKVAEPWMSISCELMPLLLAIKPPLLDAFSFNLLFDVDLRRGLTVGKNTGTATVTCAEGYHWMSNEQKCRKRKIFIQCPKHSVWNEVDGVCIFIPQKATKKPHFDSDLSNSSDVSIRLLVTIKNATFRELENSELIKKLSLKAATLEQVEPVGNNLILIINTTTNNVTHTKAKLLLVLNDIFRNNKGVKFRVLQDGEYVGFVQMFNCTVYEESEFTVLENHTLYLKPTGHYVEPSKYKLKNKKAIVCIDTGEGNKSKNETTSSGSKPLGLVTITCTSLSIVALIVRLVLHCLVPSLDKVASGMQACLAVALLLAITGFLLHPFMVEFPVVCYTVAVFIHWAFLSAFTWMTMIAIDICRMLRSSLKLILIGSRRISFIVYQLVAWGLPALIITVSVALDLTKVTDPLWWPFYGKQICWISNRYALLLYFAVPAAVEFFISFIMFIICLLILRRTQSNSDVSQHNHKERLSVHVKLIVLTGLSWVFGFLAVPLGVHALWYIFTILNASQGFFLLITFLSGSNVRENLCNKYGFFRKRSREQSKINTSMTPCNESTQM